MTEGTVAPISFTRQGVADWFNAQSPTPSEGTLNTLCLVWAADGSVATGVVGHGSVRIGRLRSKQGSTAQDSVQDSQLTVRVDRHGSHVGNPFAGAPVAKLCKAFDELLCAVLTIQLSVEAGLHDYEGLQQDASYGAALLTPFEETLLRTVSEKHQVPVHRQRVRPLALRAWLVYHARLIQLGRPLCLSCWCMSNAAFAPAWTCHAQSLMGALLWASVTLRFEPLFHYSVMDVELPSLQVQAYLSKGVTLSSSSFLHAFFACAFFLPLAQIVEALGYLALCLVLLPIWVTLAREAYHPRRLGPAETCRSRSWNGGSSGRVLWQRSMIRLVNGGDDDIYLYISEPYYRPLSDAVLSPSLLASNTLRGHVEDSMRPFEDAVRSWDGGISGQMLWQRSMIRLVNGGDEDIYLYILEPYFRPLSDAVPRHLGLAFTRLRSRPMTRNSRPIWVMLALEACVLLPRLLGDKVPCLVLLPRQVRRALRQLPLST